MFFLLFDDFFIPHILKHGTLKKEPDPVTEKKAGGSGKYDKFGDRLRVLIVTLEKERTKLRDEKF